ncbi:hypothetical protein Ciccas_003914 [Cichlidogyrus casuarinus]|uniref:Uncharacterized protein n=1 Tax=Cichlidogyrus casuarinus TaxID=1844966 RepID=A0ABD2QD04_9PLAT
MEDLLEGNDVQDPKMVSRIVGAAFQKADYPLRERIHRLTSENKLNWPALKSSITSMLLPDPVETMIQDFHEVARDDLAPSEKFERIKALMSSPTDGLAYWMCSIGYPLAFRAQHHAASIKEQMDHPAVMRFVRPPAPQSRHSVVARHMHSRLVAASMTSHG